MKKVELLRAAPNMDAAVGDTVELTDDKADNWVARGTAVFPEDEGAAEAVEEAEEVAEIAEAAEAEGDVDLSEMEDEDNESELTMRNNRDELLAAAEAAGVEVEDGAEKADILEALYGDE